MITTYCLVIVLLLTHHCSAKPSHLQHQFKEQNQTKTSSELASCSHGPKQCVFPFIFNNRIITSCTTIDGDTTPWCATSVSREEKMTGWGYCARDCPGVKDVEMYVHPDNAVGSCGGYNWVSACLLHVLSLGSLWGSKYFGCNQDCGRL